MMKTAVLWGFAAAFVLLAIYFSIVSAISGWNFASDQFLRYWYYITTLATGFGIQVGLYVHLSNIVRASASRGAVVVSGATSTVAMLSCCAHYLANLIPIIGISGAIALVGQYQIELFWIGLVANAVWIGYIANRINRFSQNATL